MICPRLADDEKGFEWICAERLYVLLMICDQSNKLLSEAVADTQPNNLGWRAVKQATLLKIRVFGDDSEAFAVRVLPNLLVRKTKQATLADVHTTREESGEQVGQFGRKVLVKEQLHAEPHSGGDHGRRQKQNRLECRRR